MALTRQIIRLLLSCLILLSSLSFSNDQLPYPKGEEDWRALYFAMNESPIKIRPVLDQHLATAVTNEDVTAELRIQLFLLESLLLESKIKEVLEKIDRLVQKAESLSSANLTLHSVLVRGKANIEAENWDSVENDLIYAKELIELTKIDFLEYEFYKTRGLMYVRINKNFLAINDYLEALRIAESLANRNVQATTLSDLSNLFLNLKLFDKALTYTEQAFDYLSEEQQFNRSIILFNLGVIYHQKEEFQQAIGYLTKARELSEEIGDTLGIAYADYQLARVYIDIERYQDAIELLTIAADYFNQFGASGMVTKAKINLAKSHILSENYSEGNVILVQIDSVSDHLQLLDRARLFEAYALYFERTDRLAKTVEYLRKFIEVNEEIERQTNITGIGEVLAQFEDKNQSIQNQLLIRDNQLKESRLQQEQQAKKISVLISLIVLVLMIVLAIALYQQFGVSKKLKHLAMVDTLTGAPNRRAVMEQLKQEITRSNNLYLPLTVGLVDLDHFKSVNDTYGHDAGDHVLIAFSKAIQSCIRTEDRFGRIGGEEWALVLPQQTDEGIESMCKRIKKELQSMNIKDIDEDYKITFSAGFSHYQFGDTSKEIMIRADQALYHAKESGRDCFSIDERVQKSLGTRFAKAT